MKPVEIMKLDDKINEVCRLGLPFLVFLGMGNVSGGSSHSHTAQRKKQAIWMYQDSSFLLIPHHFLHLQNFNSSHLSFKVVSWWHSS